MNVLAVVAFVLIGLVLLLAVWVVVVRARQRGHEAALRDAIRTYVEGRGGSVTFDEQGMVVKGPLGEGRERMTALAIMCPPDSRARWATSIGFVLRNYIPDLVAEMAAKDARKRLAEALPGIDALPEEDLRGRQRIQVCSKRSPSEGLVTCAHAIGARFEARVILDGFDLQGIPAQARARLPEGDEAIYGRALTATLGEAPAAEAGEVGDHAWLCRVEQVFGQRPFLIVSEGAALAWVPAERGTSEKALAALAGRSLKDGPMKGVMFAWDGAALSEVSVLHHTIIGPDTPDHTLQLPATIVRALGVVAGPDGRIGVRR